MLPNIGDHRVSRQSHTKGPLGPLGSSSSQHRRKLFCRKTMLPFGSHQAPLYRVSRQPAKGYPQTRLRRLLHPRTSSGSIPRSHLERGHGPIIVLVMARVGRNSESSWINSVISNRLLPRQAQALPVPACEA